MTNYQSPYTPPGDSNLFPLPWPPGALLAARRAAILMFVLSGLALAVGGMFFLGSMVPPDQIAPEQQQKIEELVAPTGLSVKTYFLFAAAMMSATGLVLGGLGFWVRRGSFAPIVISIVVDALMLLGVVFTIFKAFIGPDANGITAACPPIGAGFIMAFLMTRLIAAAKANRQAKAMQWQYWQSQPPNSGPGNQG